MDPFTTSKYGLGVTSTLPFDDTIDAVKHAFQAQGFGTLTTIDIRKTLEEKLGRELEPYTIIGMCNPHLASRAIDTEYEIGLLLPCNVLICMYDGTVHIRVQAPEMMVNVTGNDQLRPIAEEARRRIDAALATLSAQVEAELV